jgi:hypothetical protein
MKSTVKKSQTEKILEKDLLKIIGFIAVLIVIYWLASTYFQSLNHFNYRGLEFTKERFDKLTVYHYYYYFKNKVGQAIQYNLYLRNDPRTNNVTVEGDKVLFENAYAYITFDSTYPSGCQDSTQAVVDLGLFLSQNQIKVFNGLMNKTEADMTNQSYFTCTTLPDSAEVIELKGGRETKIRAQDNCNEIIIGPDCRVQEAIEKFKLESLINARNVSTSTLQ